MFKRKRKAIIEDVAEQRFDDMMALVKNLSRPDYNRLKQAMDLAYEAYCKVKNVKSDEEKDFADIEQVEKKAEKIIKEREAKNAKKNSIKND